MKFNIVKNAFKSAYSNEKETNQTRPYPVDKVRHEEPPEPIIERRYTNTEKVAGGDIIWKPIDRVAAKMIMKAPWWAHPPIEISSPKQTQTTSSKTMSQSPKSMSSDPGPWVKNLEGVVAVPKSDDQFNSEIATHAIKKTRSSIDSANELLEKALDARAALDVMCSQWLPSWVDFMQTSDQRLKDLRMTRVAFDTEQRLLMASLKEVRAFFLDKDYETERNRLKEFVDICERLKALKESGFLDTVADTMLKLS